MIFDFGAEKPDFNDVHFIAKHPRLVGAVARLAIEVAPDPSAVIDALTEQVYASEALTGSKPGLDVIDQVRDGLTTTNS